MKGEMDTSEVDVVSRSDSERIVLEILVNEWQRGKIDSLFKRYNEFNLRYKAHGKHVVLNVLKELVNEE